MNIGKFLWGIVILIIGFIFLMVNFGLANYSIFSELWKLWPIILVVIGLTVLGRASSRPLEIIFDIVAVLLVLGAFLWFVLTMIKGETPFKTNSSTSNSTFSSETTTKEISETLNPSAQEGEINLKTGASTINLERY